MPKSIIDQLISNTKPTELDKSKREAFEKAAKPLMEFLADNYNPHTKVIVDNSRAEIVCGEMCFNTDEFIKD